MTGPPRDWDKEMAEIDKLIAKQPGPVPGVRAQGSEVRGTAPALPAPRGAPQPVVPRSGRAVLTTWARVLLGVAAAAGVTFAWPYAHACGLSLYGYLAAAAGVALAGIWGAVVSWQRRLGLAHLISLLVTLAGAALVGKTILDRTDYPKQPSAWSCS